MFTPDGNQSSLSHGAIDLAAVRIVETRKPAPLTESNQPNANNSRFVKDFGSGFIVVASLLILVVLAWTDLLPNPAEASRQMPSTNFHQGAASPVGQQLRSIAEANYAFETNLYFITIAGVIASVGFAVSVPYIVRFARRI